MVNVVRNAIEMLYKGKCTVYEYQSVKDPITKITKSKPIAVLIDQPCKLSVKYVTSAKIDDVATISQASTLFISPDITINPGSKLSVTQNGVTTEYQQSGQPGRYSNHQEIALELFKGWA